MNNHLKEPSKLFLYEENRHFALPLEERVVNESPVNPLEFINFGYIEDVLPDSGKDLLFKRLKQVVSASMDKYYPQEVSELFVKSDMG